MGEREGREGSVSPVQDSTEKGSGRFSFKQSLRFGIILGTFQFVSTQGMELLASWAARNVDGPMDMSAATPINLIFGSIVTLGAIALDIRNQKQQLKSQTLISF